MKQNKLAQQLTAQELAAFRRLWVLSGAYVLVPFNVWMIEE